MIGTSVHIQPKALGLRIKFSENIFDQIPTNVSNNYRECKDVQIDINCDHYRGGNTNRAKRQADQSSDDGGTYVLDAQIPVEK